MKEYTFREVIAQAYPADHRGNAVRDAHMYAISDVLSGFLCMDQRNNLGFGENNALGVGCKLLRVAQGEIAHLLRGNL